MPHEVLMPKKGGLNFSERKSLYLPELGQTEKYKHQISYL